MNIFIIDKCPYKSARYLDDRRLNKMILESTQMLSTSLNVYGKQGPYKTTHINHPCTKWVRKTKGNYSWLLNYYKCLCLEYSKRRNKIHKCQQYIEIFSNFIYVIPNGILEPFINCTQDFKHIKNIYEAYKLQLDQKFIKDKEYAFCTIGGSYEF